MQPIYDNNLLIQILQTFNIKKLVISGINDENFLKKILNYDADFIQINTSDKDCLKDNPLNALQELENYDGIFLNDDPNWYTVFNELNIIKETNTEFPLVFICNNNFPNKRRDSYINPNKIPKKFRQKYTNNLSICYNDKKIIITDGLYHASNENTPKNGVFTAIEDFMIENTHIGIMKINFIREICILYQKSQINLKRVSIINNYIQDKKINNINLSDTLIENQLLISYIKKYKLYNENLNEFEVELSKKNSIITDFENKLRLQNNELNLKNAKISRIESNLNLKDSQIKNIESKLVNREKKINKLENQLDMANKRVYSLNHEVTDNSNKIISLENQLKTNHIKFNELKEKEYDYTNQINSLNIMINQKDEVLKNTQNKLNIEEMEVNSLKNDLTQKQNELNNQIKKQQIELDKTKKIKNYLEHSYTKQLSKIDNTEYCIHCIKEEISNNHLEIKYLKNNTFTKKIFSPLSYLYLILKSNPKEISLNLKLYNALKDSKCFDIGFYLNKNPDLIESKWCKYFSPELHYVCFGFDEQRTFNRKYFTRNSKKALFDYLLICDE